MQAYSIKVQYNDDIRRFSLPRVSWIALINQIKQIYNLPEQEFVVKYKDDEGDWITVSSDEELGVAFGLVEGLLRLTITNAATTSEVKNVKMFGFGRNFNRDCNFNHPNQAQTPLKFGPAGGRKTFRLTPEERAKKITAFKEKVSWLDEKLKSDIPQERKNNIAKRKRIFLEKIARFESIQNMVLNNNTDTPQEQSKEVGVNSFDTTTTTVTPQKDESTSSESNEDLDTAIEKQKNSLDELKQLRRQIRLLREDLVRAKVDGDHQKVSSIQAQIVELRGKAVEIKQQVLPGKCKRERGGCGGKKWKK